MSPHSNAAATARAIDLDEPSRRTGFSGNVLDRQSEERGPNAIAEAQGHAAAQFYLFQEDRALLQVSGPALNPLFRSNDPLIAESVIETLVLLGYDTDGAPRLAARIPADLVLSDDIKAIDLRSLAYQALIADNDLGAIAQARSMTGWHARHGFCANCGAKTEMSQGGYRRDCGACSAQHFPRVDPVVIMLIHDRDRALLGRSQRFNTGMYSCLAGFLEPGETVENAVRRETLEEAGITVGAVTYHASQPWPFPSTLMIGCMGVAMSTNITVDDNELEDARWFDKAELGEMLSGTHSDELFCPPRLAIAYELIRAFVEE